MGFEGRVGDYGLQHNEELCQRFVRRTSVFSGRFHNTTPNVVEFACGMADNYALKDASLVLKTVSFQALKHVYYLR